MCYKKWFEDKEFSNCGLCQLFTCEILNSFAYDQKDSDNAKRLPNVKYGVNAMSSTIDFVEYVVEQIRDLDNIRYRKMFGEYMLYINKNH